LLPVLLERLLGFLLRFGGLLEPALDRLGPFLQRLLDPREEHPVQNGEHDEERDCADDQLGKANC